MKAARRLEQFGIAFDQWLNTAIGLIVGGGWADETMSSRIYRGARDGKWWGQLLMPPVNFVFGLWQGPGHCFHAYLKEKERANLPPEFRT